MGGWQRRIYTLTLSSVERRRSRRRRWRRRRMGCGGSLRSAWSVGAMWAVALPLTMVSAVRWEKRVRALTRPPASAGERTDSDYTDILIYKFNFVISWCITTQHIHRRKSFNVYAHTRTNTHIWLFSLQFILAYPNTLLIVYCFHYHPILKDITAGQPSVVWISRFVPQRECFLFLATVADLLLWRIN